MRKFGKCKIIGKSGETLVEAVVCAAIFLMMAAVMQGAISFCTNAQRKSREIRENNARICHNLRETEISSDGIVQFTFKATSADGGIEGREVFTIQVPLGKKVVIYEDGQGVEQTVVFDLYGPAGVMGGDGP